MADRNYQSALFCIGLMSRLRGFPLNMEHIQHNFFPENKILKPVDLAKILKEIGFETKILTSKLSSIKSRDFPLIATDHNDDFFLIIKQDDHNSGKYLIQKAGANRSEWNDNLEFNEEIRTLISTRKKDHTDEFQKDFGFSWFFRASMK